LNTSRAAAGIAARFAEYLARIEPRQGVLDAAVKRSAGIHGAILRSMQVARVARVGSFYKGTAIANASDLDFFVVIRREDVRWAGTMVSSATVLGNIRSAILDRYPRSNIGKDGSAVVVEFADGIPIDVVPAIFASPLQTGHPLYSIPDGEGGYLDTAPDAQRAAFLAADFRAGGKLSRVIKLVKTWAYYRDAPLPISSFYLETVLATAGIADGPRSYSAALSDAMKVLAERGVTALRDPLGISGNIPPARTRAQRELIARSLSFAADHAECAYDAERGGDTSEAARQWRMVLPGFRGLLGTYGPCADELLG